MKGQNRYRDQLVVKASSSRITSYQAFSEPVLNRVAVKRLTVVDAIREVASLGRPEYSWSSGGLTNSASIELLLASKLVKGGEMSLLIWA